MMKLRAVNHRADTEVKQATGSQEVEGTGGCSVAQGRSVEGMTNAIAGGILCSHKKH